MAAFGAVDEVEAVAEEVNAGCVTEVVDWGRDDKFVVDEDRGRGSRH